MKEIQFIRPTTIRAELYDPFDGALVCASVMPYNARLVARCILSRHFARLKKTMRTISANILEGRTPRLRITFGL